MTHLNYLWWIYPLGCAALGALLAGGTREPEKNANPALPEGPPALDPSPVIPIDLSFGYLSAELKSPVKIPIPIEAAEILEPPVRASAIHDELPEIGGG
jgi:hypothetical protein